MKTKGKTAIVTGGGKGIGLNIVQSLIDKECRVGVFDKDFDLLEKLRQRYREISCFHCDVSDPKQVEKSVGSFYNDFKKNCVVFFQLARFTFYIIPGTFG